MSKESLDNYYKLKNKYDEKINEEKKKIIKASGSWKEKRKEFSKLKFKCVSCKRPVGTDFFNVIDENENRNIGALCGDKTNPCGLNIKIKLGIFTNLRDDILSSKNDISENKNKIIIEKNNEIFGYVSSDKVIENYEKIYNDINNDIELYEYSNQLYNNIVYNEERINELNKLETDLNIEIVEIKQLCKDYNNTNNIALIKNVVESYIKNIVPMNKEIMNKKYSNSCIEKNGEDNYNNQDNTYHLIQTPFEYSVDLLEFDTSTEKVGVIIYNTEQSKTKTKGTKEKKDKEPKEKKDKEPKEKKDKEPKEKKERKKTVKKVKGNIEEEEKENIEEEEKENIEEEE